MFIVFTKMSDYRCPKCDNWIQGNILKKLKCPSCKSKREHNTKQTGLDNIFKEIEEVKQMTK